MAIIFLSWSNPMLAQISEQQILPKEKMSRAWKPLIEYHYLL